MTYHIDDVCLVWHDACAKTIDMIIRDIDPHQPDDRDWIEMMWRDLGWGDWFLDARGGEGYDEAPESWCGAGPAWVGRHRVGEFLEEQMCMDIQLHSDLASWLLPGTDRLYDQSRWDKYDLSFPGIDAEELTDEEISDILQPGFICTVGEGEDGSHIIMVDEVNEGTLDTLEANAHGVIGNGLYGEGYVRRYDTTVEGYDGKKHRVKPREFGELKMIYPPQPEWWVGSVEIEGR